MKGLCSGREGTLLPDVSKLSHDSVVFVVAMVSLSVYLGALYTGIVPVLPGSVTRFVQTGYISRCPQVDRFHLTMATREGIYKRSRCKYEWFCRGASSL